MASERPQNHENTLVSIAIDEGSLLAARNVLDEAVRRGLSILDDEQDGARWNYQEEHGNIFSGGQGLACLNLYRAVLKGPNEVELRVHLTLVERYVLAELPTSISFKHGRTSPLCHVALGSVFLRLAVIALKEAHPGFLQEHDAVQTERDLSVGLRLLNEAVEYAVKQPTTVPFNAQRMGIDEVLYGRAGLLWAMLLLRNVLEGAAHSGASSHGPHIQSVLQVFSTSISRVMDAIVSAGWEYCVDHRIGGEDSYTSPRLTWPWISPYHSLGAMHGDSGILAVLLLMSHTELGAHWVHLGGADGEYKIVSKQASDTPEPKYAVHTSEIIERSITGLCRVCVHNDGHLPMSDPPFPAKTERRSPLMQICHGTPGLLLLLACARRNQKFRDKHWQPSWNEAFKLGSERVWEQGLLSKGGGICHGIAGNALPWILWAEVDVDEGWDVSPYLERALAFLEECMNTKPFGEDVEDKYRMPDHPYSLFEGLAGTVMVWMEALRVVEKKLARM